MENYEFPRDRLFNKDLTGVSSGGEEGGPERSNDLTGWLTLATGARKRLFWYNKKVDSEKPDFDRDVD